MTRIFTPYLAQIGPRQPYHGPLVDFVFAPRPPLPPGCDTILGWAPLIRTSTSIPTSCGRTPSLAAEFLLPEPRELENLGDWSGFMPYDQGLHHEETLCCMGCRNQSRCQQIKSRRCCYRGSSDSPMACMSAHDMPMSQQIPQSYRERCKNSEIQIDLCGFARLGTMDAVLARAAQSASDAWMLRASEPGHDELPGRRATPVEDESGRAHALSRPMEFRREKVIGKLLARMREYVKKILASGKGERQADAHFLT
ncbi:uncharacterized protein BDR25DRAFT_391351 [Lindgomyces ingoldianus]|uniref:Uncharacterized protein n=1 Tax=Lindgomyces ingoldianus TaxID=673940 RepID=A0ACB6RCJ2_9PLEO|nr:uncharacterized protein BDR25DRAFT_391351 [Lindgomyces ingoldianus]KAF2476047.1 hypothetical protein BDR25DRAFT_391351 [Lindgomyces ingoldianus]